MGSSTSLVASGSIDAHGILDFTDNVGVTKRLNTITRFSPDILAFNISIKNYTGFYIESASGTLMNLKNMGVVYSVSFPANLRCKDDNGIIQTVSNSENLFLAKSVNSDNVIKVIEESNCEMTAKIPAPESEHSDKVIASLLLQSPSARQWKSLLNIIGGDRGIITSKSREAKLIIRPDLMSHLISWLFMFVVIITLPAILKAISKEIKDFHSKGFVHFYK